MEGVWTGEGWRRTDWDLGKRKKKERKHVFPFSFRPSLHDERSLTALNVTYCGFREVPVEAIGGTTGKKYGYRVIPKTPVRFFNGFCSVRCGRTFKASRVRGVSGKDVALTPPLNATRSRRGLFTVRTTLCATAQGPLRHLRPRTSVTEGTPSEARTHDSHTTHTHTYVCVERRGFF